MIKKFEQYQDYRDVNLIQFVRDFRKYENQLEGSLISHIRNMLMYKKVSFQDSVMREGTSGTVKEINYNICSNSGAFSSNEFLSMYFEEDRNTRTFSLKYKEYQHKNIGKFINRAPIIRISNSEKTPIEKQIEIIKYAEKYNI